MKLIIAGGRDYHFTQEDLDALDELHLLQPVTEVVSGAQRGADTEGERWAASHGIPVKQFPARFAQLGRKAGPLRNYKMARYADAVVLFPGGKGTLSMYREALDAGIHIYDWRHR